MSTARGCLDFVVAVVVLAVGWYGWIKDMDLSWLVLVANMKMAMCVCDFFFHENDADDISRRTSPLFASLSHGTRREYISLFNFLSRCSSLARSSEESKSLRRAVFNRIPRKSNLILRTSLCG